MDDNYKQCQFYKKPECISCQRQMSDCEQGIILKSPAELREEGKKQTEQVLYWGLQLAANWSVIRNQPKAKELVGFKETDDAQSKFTEAYKKTFTRNHKKD